jgi:glyoxalase family protein
MALEGLHHITAITGDAPGNVDFYARVLGLRMVKKTVNFDQPDVYHLYYADEAATPGAALTFFEYPGAPPGRAGDGMVHTIQWRVASAAAIAFWRERLHVAGVEAEGDGDDRLLRFADPEGLGHELLALEVPDAPLAARAADIPAEHALLGFHGVRAYASQPGASAALLEALGFAREAGSPDGWLARGEQRHGVLVYDVPPAQRGNPSAGTVHHVAWSAADDAELEAFRARVARGGARPTPIIDRQYFHSVYFREPSGVLFELASRDLGFDVDEPLETLGEALTLPPQHEPLRAELERRLAPITNPRTGG